MNELRDAQLSDKERERRRKGKEAKKELRAKRISFNLEEEPTPPPMLVEGMIPYPAAVMVLGKAKSRKSFFSMQLAISIASGLSKFLECEIDRDITPKGGRPVAYFDFENASYDVQLRANRMCRKISDSTKDPAEALRVLQHRLAKNLRHYSLPPYFLESKEARDDLIDNICKLIDCDLKGKPPALIVIDPVYCLIPKENEQEYVNHFMSLCLELRNIYGCSVVFAHHTTKEGFKNKSEFFLAASGSGVFSRAYDHAIGLYASGDRVELLQHSRTIGKPKSIGAIFEDGLFVRNDDHLGKPIGSIKQADEYEKNHARYVEITQGLIDESKDGMIERSVLEKAFNLKKRSVDGHIKLMIERNEIAGLCEDANGKNGSKRFGVPKEETD